MCDDPTDPGDSGGDDGSDDSDGDGAADPFPGMGPNGSLTGADEYQSVPVVTVPDLFPDDGDGEPGGGGGTGDGSDQPAGGGDDGDGPPADGGGQPADPLGGLDAQNNPPQPAPPPVGNGNPPGGGPNGPNIDNPLLGGTSTFPNGGGAGYQLGTTTTPNISLYNLLTGGTTDFLSQLGSTQFALTANYQSAQPNGTDPYLTVNTQTGLGSANSPNLSGTTTLTAYSPNGDGTYTPYTFTVNGTQGTGVQLNAPLPGGNLTVGVRQEAYALLTGNTNFGGTGFVGVGPKQVVVGATVPATTVGVVQVGGNAQLTFPLGGGQPQVSALITLTGGGASLTVGAQSQNGSQGFQVDLKLPF